MSKDIDLMANKVAELLKQKLNDPNYCPFCKNITSNSIGFQHLKKGMVQKYQCLECGNFYGKAL